MHIFSRRAILQQLLPDAAVAARRVPFVPFDSVKEVLGDLVYVEELVSGEREVEAAPQCHLPQFLGGLVCVQTAVAQEEADWKKSKAGSKVRVINERGWEI